MTDLVQIPIDTCLWALIWMGVLLGIGLTLSWINERIDKRRKVNDK